MARIRLGVRHSIKFGTHSTRAFGFIAFYPQITPILKTFLCNLWMDPVSSFCADRPLHQPTQERLAATRGPAQAARHRIVQAFTTRRSARVGPYLSSHGFRPRDRARRIARSAFGQLPEQSRHSRARSHLSRRVARRQTHPAILHARAATDVPTHLALHVTLVFSLHDLLRLRLRRYALRSGIFRTRRRRSYVSRDEHRNENPLVGNTQRPEPGWRERDH